MYAEFRADSLIVDTAPDVSIGSGSPFHHSAIPTEELFGIHIKLPKIPVGRIVGNVVKQVVPGGSTIVGAANAAIHAVKDAKLQPKNVLRDVGEQVVDAAAAQIKNNIANQVSKNNPTAGAAFGIAGGTWLVPALIVLGVILIARK